jgi:hypothetical protein
MYELNLIDNICGSGKTTAMLNSIREVTLSGSFRKFIYVSPQLSEVGGEVSDQGEYQDGRVQKDFGEIGFKYPINFGEGKSEQFKSLIIEGHNISCTHECFKRLSEDDISLIEDGGYELVIDESMDAYEQFEISKAILKLCLDSDSLVKRLGDKVEWNFNKMPLENLDHPILLRLANACMNKSVFVVGDGINSYTAIITEFPMNVLNAFKKVTVITYRFNHTLMSVWCSLNNVAVNDVTSHYYDHGMRCEEEIKQNIKGNLLIYKPTNEFKETLSFSFYDKAKPHQLVQLKQQTTTFAKYINRKSGITTKDLLITCPKSKFYSDWKDENTSGKGILASSKYTGAKWLYSKARATNEYSSKRAVIYLTRSHINPMIIRSLGDHKLDKMGYSLTELIQFMWRGCIRNSELMHISIPNVGLREALEKWLIE